MAVSSHPNHPQQALPAIRKNIPAFQSIHELSRSIEAFPHEGGLLPHGYQCILKQARLIFWWRRRGHGQAQLYSGGVARDWLSKRRDSDKHRQLEAREDFEPDVFAVVGEGTNLEYC